MEVHCVREQLRHKAIFLCRASLAVNGMLLDTGVHAQLISADESRSSSPFYTVLFVRAVSAVPVVQMLMAFKSIELRISRFILKCTEHCHSTLKIFIWTTKTKSHGNDLI